CLQRCNQRASIDDFTEHLFLRQYTRGLALSATITEIVMQDFDNSIKELDGVFYYGRYVDDIIVVTDRLVYRLKINFSHACVLIATRARW
ncbi:phage-related reverse transcriptase/maturase family protein, partial [Pseudomonas syringae pv. actinidiae ICMP 19103]